MIEFSLFTIESKIAEILCIIVIHRTLLKIYLKISSLPCSSTGGGLKWTETPNIVVWSFFITLKRWNCWKFEDSEPWENSADSERATLTGPAPRAFAFRKTHILLQAGCPVSHRLHFLRRWFPKRFAGLLHRQWSPDDDQVANGLWSTSAQNWVYRCGNGCHVQTLPHLCGLVEQFQGASFSTAPTRLRHAMLAQLEGIHPRRYKSPR